jgi:hypothetical protein
MRNETRLSSSIFFTIFSIIFAIAFSPERYSLFNDSINITLTVIVLLNVFVFFNSIKSYYQSWVRYDTLFIIGFLIVHFQIPFLAAIGIDPTRPDYIWINKQVVNFATWFSTIVFLLWMLGFYLFLVNKNESKQVDTLGYQLSSKYLNALTLIFTILFILLVGREFLSGAYNGTSNWGAGATYIFLLLRIFLTLNIIYLFINNANNDKKEGNVFRLLMTNKVLFGTSAVIIFIFLLAGDRGAIMQIGLIYLGAYGIYMKNISFKKLIVLISIAAIVFTVMRLGRTNETLSGNIFSRGIKNVQKEDGLLDNPTNELATSVRILYRGLDVVPDKHPYLNGVTLISNLVDVIPFSSSIYHDLTGIPAMYTNSTTFFTILGQGPNYTYGEGSEIIADIYINLGFWLTLFVFVCFGYFISYITYKVYFSSSHRIIIMYLVLLSFSLYTNRSNFLNPLKDVIWTLIIDRLLTKKIF